MPRSLAAAPAPRPTARRAPVGRRPGNFLAHLECAGQHHRFRPGAQGFGSTNRPNNSTASPRNNRADRPPWAGSGAGTAQRNSANRPPTSYNGNRLVLRHLLTTATVATIHRVRITAIVATLRRATILLPAATPPREATRLHHGLSAPRSYSAPRVLVAAVLSGRRQSAHGGGGGGVSHGGSAAVGAVPRWRQPSLSAVATLRLSPVNYSNRRPAPSDSGAGLPLSRSISRVLFAPALLASCNSLSPVLDMVALGNQGRQLLSGASAAAYPIVNSFQPASFAVHLHVMGPDFEGLEVPLALQERRKRHENTFHHWFILTLFLLVLVAAQLPTRCCGGRR